MKLPVIPHNNTINPLYIAYLNKLALTNYLGDIDSSYAGRIAQATDNSVYQFIPQAILYPKNIQDIQLACQLANIDEYKEIIFTPRGGGTGTNGQSLSHGIIIDLSRYMTHILEINTQEKWVRVEAGVIKDALNDFLRPYGYFFSPDLSTSNRATLGGMINTDASGAGSLVYGKTSDHILGLKSVLIDGSSLITEPLNQKALAELESQDSLEAKIYQYVVRASQENRELIKKQFPDLNRFLTGYDLKHIWNDDFTQFDLSRLITGSEGTLAIVAEAKVNIMPLPEKKIMVTISYDSFDMALRHAPELVNSHATLVETIDAKILDLAKADIVWHSVSDHISEPENFTIQGLNMVEFTGDENHIQQKLHNLIRKIETKSINNGVIGYKVTDDATSINNIYAMRKKAVGLLGASEGMRKPIAFVEDTAVPPEKLADYIMEFRQLLDSHHLEYGMFGHVDAGVLHVRPALDMCNEEDEKLLKLISDKVAKLTTKYGGLMWGEHGKGVRSEYAANVFGETLYDLIRGIKTCFDPDNRLNPGKIAAPFGFHLIYDVNSKKRGHFDKLIPTKVKNTFPDPINCNGNGLCFNYNYYSPMCPSYKVTSDRLQSPKGRAGLMREWLRLVEQENIDVIALAKQKNQHLWQRFTNTYIRNTDDDFSHDVMASLKGCLACKACASQCPVKVDVAKFRTQFFELYYQRYMRPTKDYLVANIEQSVQLMAKIPRLANFVSQNSLSKWAIKKIIGYVDTPSLSVPTLHVQLFNQSAIGYDFEDLSLLSESDKQKYVLVVQDPFNSYYDADLVFNFVQLIEKIGFKPILLPFKPNGKPAHIKGFLKQFIKTAKNAADFFNRIATLNIPMVGIDPALVLVYRDEYKQVLGDERGNFTVKLVNEWLLEKLETIPKLPINNNHEFTWFSHCTESSMLPNTGSQWETIFYHFGAKLHTANLGCCGMAGTYGHELENLTRSRTLFAMSWEDKLASLPQEQVLISGYSCRSQVKRFAHFRPKHPLEALLLLLQNNLKTGE